MKKFWNRIKIFVKEFFLIDDTPHKIAAGAALGVFWGIMPGEGVAVTLVTASILRFNRLSATAGVIASNMWMTAAAMPLAAYFGGKLYGVDPQMLINDFKSTYNLGFKNFFAETIFSHLLLPLIAGFLGVSLAISFFVYIVLYLLLKYKKIKFR